MYINNIDVEFTINFKNYKNLEFICFLRIKIIEKFLKKFKHLLCTMFVCNVSFVEEMKKDYFEIVLYIVNQSLTLFFFIFT